MARYRHIDMSPRLLPVDLQAQLVPGSFAHAVHHLVDQLDLSAFDAHYRNDESGAPAHAPVMLLKAVLLAYSQGMVSSRSIERACRDNVLFIALTGDAKPHFTTIADFVSRSREAIATVFAQVLTLLDGEGLIGREMFAIDGVKLPSNASKHRSGTRAGFLAQAQKMERAATTMLERHQANEPVILHSDRGSQFRSGDYQRYLLANALVSSMSAVGHCGDNAACEGFFGLLKRERIYRMTYPTLDAARADVFEYIERHHNPRMRRRTARQDLKFSTLSQPSVISG